MDRETLPSGERFRFWDDATEYQTIYHVAQQHSGASDENPGSAAAPWRTDRCRRAPLAARGKGDRACGSVSRVRAPGARWHGAGADGRL